MTDTAGDLVGRLQRDISDADRESYMIEWDGIRRQVLDDMGDLPRLKFESVLDAKDDLLRQAADRISADQARIQVLETRVSWLEENPLHPYCDYKCGYKRDGKTNKCDCGLSDWEAREPNQALSQSPTTEDKT